MNVGVFLSDYLPEAGGGYTFQADIFKALIELASESHHRFTLFTKQPRELREIVTSDRFQIVPISDENPWSDQLRPPAVAAPSPARTLVRRVADRALQRHSQPGSVQSFPSLEEIFKQAGVEFMWYLSANGFPIDIPYLTVVWDLQHRLQPWFPEVSEGGEWEAREAIYTRVLQRASIIVTGTRAGRDEIQRFYQVPDERIKILPHPTPQFAFEESADAGSEILAKYGISKEYLFYPAQFWAHKNHVNLLMAVRILRESYGLTFPVVLVGSDKGNEGYVRQVVEDLDLKGQVHFLGFVPREDLIALYTHAFALLYLTFFGPENLPPLEAFAFGCPVVASQVSGAEEQLGEAALLVSPQDPEKVALAIKSLHDNPQLRQELIETGRQRASAWTGRDFVRRVFTILDDFESVRRSWRGSLAQ